MTSDDQLNRLDFYNNDEQNNTCLVCFRFLRYLVDLVHFACVLNCERYDLCNMTSQSSLPIQNFSNKKVAATEPKKKKMMMTFLVYPILY